MSNLKKTKNNKKNRYKKYYSKYKNYYSDSLIKILTADSIFSEVMLGKNYLGTTYRAKAYKSIDKKSDNYLVYCSSFNKIWENHYKYNPTVYHNNVPTYGKKRVQCKKCEGKKENE